VFCHLFQRRFRNAAALTPAREFGYTRRVVLRGRPTTGNRAVTARRGTSAVCSTQATSFAAETLAEIAMNRARKLSGRSLSRLHDGDAPWGQRYSEAILPAR
jgi:hypothetical protein